MDKFLPRNFSLGNWLPIGDEMAFLTGQGCGGRISAGNGEAPLRKTSIHNPWPQEGRDRAPGPDLVGGPNGDLADTPLVLQWPRPRPCRRTFTGPGGHIACATAIPSLAWFSRQTKVITLALTSLAWHECTHMISLAIVCIHMNMGFHTRAPRIAWTECTERCRSCLKWSNKDVSANINFSMKVLLSSIMYCGHSTLEIAMNFGISAW